MNLRPIHERARAAAAVARLPLRAGQWTGAAGGILGRGTGSSIDFQDQRQYVPGDDPRHINWQAFARTGAWTMKLYREEVTPRIDLVLDQSGSMFLDEPKETRAWEVAYLCLESGLQLGGHVRLHVLGRAAAEPPVEWPLERALAHEWPDRTAPPEPATLAAQVARVPLRAGSLRVLVSDLLDESPPAAVVSALTAGRGRAVVLAPFARSEAEPDWEGNVDFEDAERATRSRQHVSPETLARYREAYRRHFALWREECLRRGVAFARVADAGDLLAALRGEAVATGAIEI
ncbi:MAG: DUF58 domain-containing protein [Planctomycetaceae bacterium]